MWTPKTTQEGGIYSEIRVKSSIDSFVSIQNTFATKASNGFFISLILMRRFQDALKEL